jgi:hypothetical protein
VDDVAVSLLFCFLCPCSFQEALSDLDPTQPLSDHAFFDAHELDLQLDAQILSTSGLQSPPAELDFSDSSEDSYSSDDDVDSPVADTRSKATPGSNSPDHSNSINTNDVCDCTSNSSKTACLSSMCCFDTDNLSIETPTSNQSVKSTSSRLVTQSSSPDPEDIEAVGEFEETTHIDIAAEISAASSSSNGYLDRSSANTDLDDSDVKKSDPSVANLVHSPTGLTLGRGNYALDPLDSDSDHPTTAKDNLECLVPSIPLLSPPSKHSDADSDTIQDPLRELIRLNDNTGTGLPPPIEVVFEHLKGFEQLLIPPTSAQSKN